MKNVNMRVENQLLILWLKKYLILIHKKVVYLKKR